VAYAFFDTPAIHAIPGIPGIKELAQAGSEMVPPLVIATARLLQVLGRLVGEHRAAGHPGRAPRHVPVTPAHLPWTVNA
jgi:hypothetical protein